MTDWKRFFEVFKDVTFNLWQGQSAAELSYQAFKGRLLEETNLRENATPEEHEQWKDLMVMKK